MHSKFRHFTYLLWLLLFTGITLLSSLYKALGSALGMWISWTLSGLSWNICRLPNHQGYNFPVHCLPQPELQLQASCNIYPLCLFTTEIATVCDT